MAKVLTSKEENYAQWYNDLVLKSGLAENSAVRGCMVIKPYGYAIWEKMQSILDGKFKKTGHSTSNWLEVVRILKHGQRSKSCRTAK